MASQPAPSTTPDVAQQHQQGQAALVGLVGAALAQAWILWNAADPAPFTAAVTAIVDRYGKASAVAALDHYRRQRLAAGVPGRPPRLTVAPTAPVGQIAAAVNWAVEDLRHPPAKPPLATPSPRAPVPVEDAAKAAQDAAKAAQDAAKVAAEDAAKAQATLDKVTGATERLVLDQGRDTIVQAVHADPAATGWARIPELGGCSFCLMLATRGAVYGEASKDFRSHNHCRCHADPCFVPRKQYALTPEVSAARDLYRKTPGGSSPADKRLNFRHAVEAPPPGAGPA